MTCILYTIPEKIFLYKKMLFIFEYLYNIFSFFFLFIFYKNLLWNGILPR